MASSSSDAHERRDAQRDALLAAPSPASEASYYAKLAAAAAASGAGHVRVERVAHGKGLVAARAFAKGERVLVEHPLVGMQQETNRADARVCGACFRYVGTVGAQIARRLLAPAMRDAAAAHGAAPQRGAAVACTDRHTQRTTRDTKRRPRLPKGKRLGPDRDTPPQAARREQKRRESSAPIER